VPLEYYHQALAQIAAHGSDVQIVHSIQTNGTLINDSWCELFSRYDIRIGVSIDGPSSIHDEHRKDRSGRGTHGRVMRGIEALKRNRIPFHVIAVVTEDSLSNPDELFQFFLDLGATYVGFNIEELEGEHQFSSLSRPALDQGVKRFFERIYKLQKNQAGSGLRIREFDRAFAAIMQGGYKNAEIAFRSNQQASPCSIITVDCDGNLSTFSPELLGITTESRPLFHFGNVIDHDILDVLENQRFLMTLDAIRQGIVKCEEQCPYFALCGGGAPANKYFENGTFASTETMYCRHTIQLPIDIVLGDLESNLRIPASQRPIARVTPEGDGLIPPARNKSKLVQISVV
jgi:uncharacterized protein